MLYIYVNYVILYVIPNGKIAKENAERKAKEIREKEEKIKEKRAAKKAEEEKAAKKRAEKSAEGKRNG